MVQKRAGGGDACDKIAVRINEGEAMPALQILKRHRLDQSRLAGARLPNDVDMQKAVFVFDAEDAAIVASPARETKFCKNGIHALTISPDSST